ncbi:uncharacterized protein LOC122510881 [Leptopilina heterotoma]|uniref:uncharacterized protein LOC122510881 n=1 Tax=Leptopilina heterotoma TaxID=63436 RepID=UPI001CA86822|nr:uncharacterized protein LOC122510881 [Leptopilina heterotoma]
MSFHRKTKIINFYYNISGAPLEKVHRQRDLGLMLDPALTYNNHIDFAIGKSLKALGQIVRSGSVFFNLRVLRIMFFALVRPHMDLLSQIYFPQYEYQKVRLERVQNIFLRFAARQLSVPYDYFSHDYEELRSQFRIPSIRSRFLKADLEFFYGILNGKIDCPSLLSGISLSVPYIFLRNSAIFKVPFSRTNLGSNSPLTRLCREANYAQSVDFFNASKSRFAQELLKHINSKT